MRIWSRPGILILAICAPALAAEPAKLPFTVSKETTIITSPLHADGTPDYVAALNQKYGKGVTAENNGFVTWLQVVGTEGLISSKPQNNEKLLELLGTKPVPAPKAPWQEYSDFLIITKGMNDADAHVEADSMEALRFRRWKSAEHANAAEYLKSQKANLDITVAAAAKTQWWIPSISGDSRHTGTIMLPSLGTMRGVARALCARATLRATEGDFDGFMRDVVTVKRLARRIATGPTLIENLVGVAIDAMGNQTIGTVAGSGAVSEEEWRALHAAARELPPLPSASEGVDVIERGIHLDRLVLIATGRSELVGKNEYIRLNGNEEPNEQVTRVLQSIAVHE